MPALIDPKHRMIRAGAGAQVGLGRAQGQEARQILGRGRGGNLLLGQRGGRRQQAKQHAQKGGSDVAHSCLLRSGKRAVKPANRGQFWTKV